MVAILVLFVCIFIIKSILVVEVNKEAVIEKFGKVYVLKHGIYLMLPFVSRIKAIVDKREQVINIVAIAMSKDGINISFDCSAFYQVVNSKAMVCEVDNVKLVLKHFVTTQLRGVIGNIRCEELIKKNLIQSVETELLVLLKKTDLEKFGIKINRIAVSKIQLPKDVQDEFERKVKKESKLVPSKEMVTDEKKPIIINAKTNEWCKNFKKYLENKEFDKLTTLFDKNVTYYKNKIKRLYTMEEIIADWKNVFESSMVLVDFEILSETSTSSIVNFYIRGRKNSDMVLKIEFNTEGKCKYFRMWEQFG